MKQKFLFLYFILLLAFVLNSCTGPTPILTATALPTPTATPTPLRKLETVDCRTPNPQLIKVDCYDLLVPEDRSKTNGRIIRLHVAVIKSKSSTPTSDPLLFLSGGPGEAGIPFVMKSQSFSGFVGSNRDIVVFDQRGTGESQPSLACPEVDQFFSDTLNQSLTQADFLEKYNEAWMTCRDRLVSEGVQLSAYNSAASAADTDDLRRALGIEKWNLFGISYGTRLALTIMRDFPQGVRSAVLDSVYPLPESLANYKVKDFRGKGSLQYLLMRCAANAECGSTFPDLENTLADLVENLNEKPISLISQVHTATGWSKGSDVSLTGDRLLKVSRTMMYSVDQIPYIPKLIADTKAGNLDLISRYILLIMPVHSFGASSGMGTSVYCVDNASSNLSVVEPVSPSKLDNILLAMSKPNEDGFNKLCQQWISAPVVPSEKPPFRSDIPALLLAGEFDPTTPVEYAELAKETLTNSYLYEFSGFGHSLTNSDSAANGCVGKLMISFWNDPTAQPDGSCVSKLKPRKFITK
jgi:pimeloyl-ACP methyl ester carboxylesterase